MNSNRWNIEINHVEQESIRSECLFLFLLKPPKAIRISNSSNSFEAEAFKNYF
jgi:hypothetical protein